MQPWKSFKKAKHFLKMPPVKIKKLGEASSNNQSSAAKVWEEVVALACVKCRMKTAVEGEDWSDSKGKGKLNLATVKVLFGGEHDFYCSLKMLKGGSEKSGTSFSTIEGLHAAERLLSSAISSSVILLGVSPKQIQRCRFSRINAIKRQLQFRVRRALALPSAKTLASVLFFKFC